MTFQVRRAVHGACMQINPDIDGTLMLSTGSTVDATAASTPTYDSTPVRLQLQEKSADDIKFLSNIQTQAITQAVYMYAQSGVIDRLNQLGGDMIIFNGTTWLTIVVNESWSTWCRILVRKQLDATA